MLIPADRVLASYPALYLDEATAAAVLHGNAFRYAASSRDTLADSLARVYDVEGQFLAIASWDAQQELWQPKKVFITP